MKQNRLKLTLPMILCCAIIGILLLTPLAVLTRLFATPFGNHRNYLPFIQADNPLPTPSATPISPFITAIPSCWTPGSPNNNIELIGGNWPTSPAAQSPITISLRDRFGNTSTLTTIPQGHGGSFSNISVNVAGFTPTNSPYYFVAQAINGAYAETAFLVPCPKPVDLIIGQPNLVSTPPINAYQPVTFNYIITNTGSADITDLFYVDTYFDPAGVTSTTIPISNSVGYVAVAMLAGGNSQIITITVPGGFTGPQTTHAVYGMVDSMQQITETVETNNISDPLMVEVTPAVITPTPTSSGYIGGIVRRFIGSAWVPQFRVPVYLIQTSGVPTPTIVALTASDINGFYFFTNAKPIGGPYTVVACTSIITPDGAVHYVAVRTGITPPNPYVDLFMVVSPQGCPIWFPPE